MDLHEMANRVRQSETAAWLDAGERQRVMKEPERFYAHPSQILRRPSLPDGAKSALLQQWYRRLEEAAACAQVDGPDVAAERMLIEVRQVLLLLQKRSNTGAAQR